MEIQVLTPATKEELILFRDEVRKIEGLESFDLQLPPAPLTPGKMDGGLGVGLIILEAVISGMTHFTAERSAEYYEEKIAHISRSIFGGKKKQADPEAEFEPMSGKDTVTREDDSWKVAISSQKENGRSVTCYDDTGSIQLFNKREYSIDPEHTYAVLIGTSQYDDRANFSPIPPVAGNLDEMYRILTDKTLVGLPYENVTRLYNESCINIKEGLRDVSRIDDIKTLIVYYSGHGQNTGNNQLSLIAKDTRNIDEDLHNDIPYSFVEKMMNLSQADQKIVFIDACHSGLAAQGNSNVFDFEPVIGTFTLASTSADDSSYFKRDSQNTYFTTYLAEAFKKGFANSNRMLSLTDLYNYTSQKLAKLRLPAPVCKAQLRNIVADNFYISGNPSFSDEARLSLPRQLYQQGKIEEARREYIQLEKEYPDNQALRQEHVEFERNTEFNRLVREGDILFFRDRNYRAARNKYSEALNIKYDENIRDKMTDCENNLTEQGQSFKSDLPPHKIPEKKTENIIPKPIPDPRPQPIKKNSLTSIKAGLITLAVLAGLFYFFTKPSKMSFEDTDYNRTHYDYWGKTEGGRPNGEGKAEFINGDKYVGHWVNGMREGKGCYILQNGEIYDGYFKNSEKNGNGVYKYNDKSVYEGGWVDNLWSGKGKFTYKEGNVYEGDFWKGYFYGNGVFTWINGEKYDGKFVNSLREGFGTYTTTNTFITNCPNCKKYSGDWIKNLKQGHGKCFDGSGVLIYEGEFDNNKPVNPIYPRQ